MKFKSIIKSHHDLKKNGYKILDKLHKLENRSDLDKIYGASCAKGCFVVLSCEELAGHLLELYSDSEDLYVQNFLKKTNLFVGYLNVISKSHSKINRSILASYLTSYTNFFNYIINYKCIRFLFDASLLKKWNAGCIMAYTAVWGNK